MSRAMDESGFTFRYRLSSPECDADLDGSGRVHAMVISMLRDLLEVVVFCDEHGEDSKVTHFRYQRGECPVYPLFPDARRKREDKGKTLNLTTSEPLRINDDRVVWVEHEDVVLVMLVDCLKVMALNKQGMFIWRLLEQNSTAGEIVASLCRQYQADQEQAEQDVLSFLHTALRLGLIGTDARSVP